jgi:hypothetical protein
MTGRRFGGAWALSLVLSAIPWSCGGSAFSSGQADSGANDGSLADGAVPDVGAHEAAPAQMDAGDAETAADVQVEAAVGGIVYVSPNGADANTGLSQLSPKRTIASALAEARTLPGLPEVHVCAGDYSETKLLISQDVVLEGAYDCATWTRTASYGFPTFDGANTTTIDNAAVTEQTATLVVTGAVTSGTLVDGFVIAGGTSQSLNVLGIHIASGASPLLKNDFVAGGSGAGGTTGTGSIGILVDGTSAPEITACVIDGGSGSGVEGSIGVDLNTTGAVNLHDATVSGGSGTFATPSNNFVTIGVRVRASLPTSTPLRQLVITGSGSNGANGRTVGLYVDGTGVSAGIAVCDISGGTSSVQSFGVYVTASGGTVALVDDRIYGGKATAGQTYGVYVSSAGALLVANSMIHAGTVPSSAGSYTVGVDMSSVASPAIAFNTIYTGAAAGTAIAMNAGVTAALLTDNLLVGSDSGLGSFGVATTACSGVVSTLDHTAFANCTALYECPPGDGGTTLAATVADLALDLGAPATAGDVVLQATCSGASGCAVVPACPGTGEACQSALFGTTWTGDGVSSLVPAAFADGGLANTDWALAAGSPCALTKGGLPVTNLTTDIDGRPRNPSTPTIGSVEYAGLVACH